MAKANRTERARSRQRSSHEEGDSADLLELLREYGVNESRISEAVAGIRALSDAQAGEGPPPTAPEPAPIDSTAELNVAAAGEGMIAEVERWQERAEAVIRSGRADAIRAHRDLLWGLEPAHFRDLPRASFVGHAIHERTSARNRRINQTSLYEAIYRANRLLLPAAIQRAVETLERRHIEGATTRKQNNNASSTVTKHVNRRVLLLQDSNLRYVESQQGRNQLEVWLTPRGRRVFNGWPDWGENPNGGAGPVAENNAGGPATESSRPEQQPGGASGAEVPPEDSALPD
jgi:hypothetical protein